MTCGRSPVWMEPTESLSIVNKTGKPVQGYWISHTNLIQKRKSAFVNAQGSANLSVRAGDCWIICDSDRNALGVFQILPGRNTIIITEADFTHTRKLPSNLVDHDFPGTTSGGSRLQEQAAYDVTHYDIHMEIFPDRKYIKATNTISATVIGALNYFVFDLDTLLTVRKVWLEEEDKRSVLDFRFQNGKYWCKLPTKSEPGTLLKVSVDYEGNPRAAANAPYQGGFSWNKTSDCRDWIATSCQVDGADLWFPCKDYQWDRPDSVKLAFTVPDGLKAVSNGVLKDTIRHGNHTTTYVWEVGTPINNYAIALNVGPFVQLKDGFTSLYGDAIDFSYWVLPENQDAAAQLYPNIKSYLAFIEKNIGPYPFRKEKLGLVEVPFVGMEHQTIIGFGPDRTTKYPGYNYVLFHELCHEWFGNMVTAKDWGDFWIQEGLTGYMEALYEESLQGATGYKEKLQIRRTGVQNKIPLAMDSIVSSRSVFGDWSYAKSVYMFHTLRYLIGKENIVKVLRLMAYPTEASARETEGRQCRYITTQDLFETIATVSGKNYDWLKQVYLYRAELPTLRIQKSGKGVVLTWVTRDNLAFNMPLEIRTREGVQRIEFADNTSYVGIRRNRILAFDPDNWILFNTEE